MNQSAIVMQWPQNPWGDFPDATTLNEAQKQKLSAMVGDALTEIRALGRDGKHGQATALADAFHNVPVKMWMDHFSLEWFRQTLESYHRSFPTGGYVDHLGQLSKIRSMP